MKQLLIIVLLTASAFAQHSVTLNCTASSTVGVTYDFYRATVSGGPYSQINLSPTSTCTFTDTIVTAGTTYYYVAKSFDSASLSVNSNQAVATIPPPPAPPTGLTVTSVK